MGNEFATGWVALQDKAPQNAGVWNAGKEI